MSGLESQRKKRLESELARVVPLCDVKGCTERMFCWIDERAHCVTHTEDLIDRWNAIGEYGGLREYVEPLPYR